MEPGEAGPQSLSEPLRLPVGASGRGSETSLILRVSSTTEAQVRKRKSRQRLGEEDGEGGERNKPQCVTHRKVSLRYRISKSPTRHEVGHTAAAGGRGEGDARNSREDRFPRGRGKDSGQRSAQDISPFLAKFKIF